MFEGGKFPHPLCLQFKRFVRDFSCCWNNYWHHSRITLISVYGISYITSSKLSISMCDQWCRIPRSERSVYLVTPNCPNTILVWWGLVWLIDRRLKLNKIRHVNFCTPWLSLLWDLFKLVRIFLCSQFQFHTLVFPFLTLFSSSFFKSDDILVLAGIYFWYLV